MSRTRLGVRIAGSGSHLGALARAARRQALGGGAIAVVICNEPEAKGIARARRLGLPVVVIAHRFAWALEHGVDALEQVPVLGPRCETPLCQRIGDGPVLASRQCVNRRGGGVRGQDGVLGGARRGGG